MEGETRWVCKGVRGVEVKGENLNEERQGEEIGRYSHIQTTFY